MEKPAKSGILSFVKRLFSRFFDRVTGCKKPMRIPTFFVKGYEPVYFEAFLGEILLLFKPSV
jgi:hypothetical protein